MPCANELPIAVLAGPARDYGGRRPRRICAWREIQGCSSRDGAREKERHGLQRRVLSPRRESPSAVCATPQCGGHLLRSFLLQFLGDVLVRVAGKPRLRMAENL